MDVADPVGVAADDLAVVAGAVFDVAGVQAQRDRFRVGVVEELVDEVLGVHMGVDMGMEVQPDVEVLLHEPPEPDWPSTRSRHCSAVSSAGWVSAPVQIRVHLGQYDQMMNIHGRQQLTHRKGIASALLECVSAAMSRRAHGSAGQTQSALAQFVLELFGIRGQVAERAELDGPEAGMNDLVEKRAQCGCWGSSGNQIPQESGAVPSARRP